MISLHSSMHFRRRYAVPEPMIYLRTCFWLFRQKALEQFRAISRREPRDFRVNVLPFGRMYFALVSTT